MKYLLDNKYAPLTFKWGFLELPLQTVGQAYARWVKGLLKSVKVTEINCSLEEALRQLEPLDMGSQRVLFLSTQSNWTAYFDNGSIGGNPATVVGYLSQSLECRGVDCASIPNTLSRQDKGKRGTWGAVMFTLYAPQPRKFLNVDRAITLINDVGGWTFRTTGDPQPFEQPERYEARKKADRFTSEMLENYCRALGIDLFNPDFYGGQGLLIHAEPRFLPKLKTIPLEEARRQIGLSAVMTERQ